MAKANRTKHVIYGAIVALAVGALAVDQLVLGGGRDDGAPAPAPAGAMPAGPTQAGRVTPPVATGGAVNRVLITDRLQAYADTHGMDLAEVPDVFAAPADWAVDPSMGGPKAGVAEARTGRPPLPGALTGVMISARNQMALIDGLVVPMGYKIDDYRLVAVTEKSATLAYGEYEVVLEMDRPGISGPSVGAGSMRVRAPDG